MSTKSKPAEVSDGIERVKPSYVKWTFDSDYPRVGGKEIVVRYLFAREERDLLVAQNDEMSGQMMDAITNKEGSGGSSVDVKIGVAKDIIVKFDGRDVTDSDRDDVWEDELDGWARADLLSFVDHCRGAGEARVDRKAPFLRG